MKARYFTIFSYIGTKFRRSQKIWLKNGSTHPDPESVQGMMEIALTKLRPRNFPMVNLSSRTDGGVHALNSTAHFDLETRGTSKYCPEDIAFTLNTFFHDTQTPILVKNCIRVPDDFNARFLAKSRTYLYRLAVLKEGIELPQNITIAKLIPLEELHRCFFMRMKKFNINRFKEGAKYFVGYHDFTTFKKYDKMYPHKQNRRTVLQMDVRPGSPMLTSYSLRTQEQLFDYWDIEIKGISFVHNQIRRMIGTLISVAVGKLPPEEIKVMLQVPSKHSWHHFIQNCPPHGLYLCNIEYDPKDLIYEQSNIDQKSDKKSVSIERDSDSE